MSKAIATTHFTMTHTPIDTHYLKHSNNVQKFGCILGYNTYPHVIHHRKWSVYNGKVNEAILQSRDMGEQSYIEKNWKQN